MKALLPRDSAGAIDWAAALKEGVIRPRWSASPRGAESPNPRFDYDFYIRASSSAFDGYFPHSGHVEWLACGSCHPGIFRYRNTPVTMDAINQGELCGRCHGTVAFPVADCERCHRGIGMPPGRLEPELLGDVRLQRVAGEEGEGAGAGSFPLARFPHWVHRIRYRCVVCHPEPFAAEVGATRVSMADIQQGEACGRCHDGRRAFGLLECTRCHAAEEEGPGP